MVLSGQAVHQVGLPRPIEPCDGHHHHRLRYLLKNLQCSGVYQQLIVPVFHQTDGVKIKEVDVLMRLGTLDYCTESEHCGEMALEL